MDIKATDTYAQKFNNVYEAVNVCSQNAKQRNQSVNNVLLMSKSLSWELTNHVNSSDIALRQTMQAYRGLSRNTVSKLKEIADPLIRYSVSQSLKLSKSSHLKYYYHPKLDAKYHARVRILTKILICDIMLEED